jgi:hypothetical protein
MVSGVSCIKPFIDPPKVFRLSELKLASRLAFYECEKPC